MPFKHGEGGVVARRQSHGGVQRLAQVAGCPKRFDGFGDLSANPKERGKIRFESGVGPL
jgi:hypothetical protein